MSIAPSRPTYAFIEFPLEEETILKQMDVYAYVKEKNLGAGTLYVGKKIIVWDSDTSLDAFEIKYSGIEVHYADVSRDTSAFEYPCAYLLLNAKKNPVGQIRFKALEKDNTVVYDDDNTTYTEVRFAPGDTKIGVKLAEAIDKAITEGDSMCVIQ